jgi:hypothetical protein
MSWLTLDFIINPIILLVTSVGAAIIGFVVGKYKIAKSRSRIVQLETEMMASHAEILELQQAYITLEKKLNDQPIPVIPMKPTGPMKMTGSKENPKEQASK